MHDIICRYRRSVFGLPLGSPLTRLYKSWSTLILMLDLVYTAFLVPILVGFEVSDVDFGWGCLVNLIAGMQNVIIRYVIL